MDLNFFFLNQRLNRHKIKIQKGTTKLHILITEN